MEADFRTRVARFFLSEADPTCELRLPLSGNINNPSEAGVGHIVHRIVSLGTVKQIRHVSTQLKRDVFPNTKDLLQARSFAWLERPIDVQDARGVPNPEGHPARTRWRAGECIRIDPGSAIR